MHRSHKRQEVTSWRTNEESCKYIPTSHKQNLCALLRDGDVMLHNLEVIQRCVLMLDLGSTLSQRWRHCDLDHTQNKFNSGTVPLSPHLQTVPTSKINFGKRCFVSEGRSVKWIDADLLTGFFVAVCVCVFVNLQRRVWAGCGERLPSAFWYLPRWDTHLSQYFQGL